ncbi:hypothetical protein Atai01_39030 [Amycolatopsis taiwanensis]|uniref:Uncharacterized protein n=1 Tax=Amycolatopsis taiwanensis TaxID=342230 RepID=A0A9W6VHI0_9PSEU|nr:hypothetical protein Atai01_39030 [Amycolatopsis taiwanensis]
MLESVREAPVTGAAQSGGPRERREEITGRALPLISEAVPGFGAEPRGLVLPGLWCRGVPMWHHSGMLSTRKGNAA